MTRQEIQEALNKYRQLGFHGHQLYYIIEGITSGLDVSKYTNHNYTSGQMKEIYEGLFSEIDVSPYANPKFNVGQMEQIRQIHLLPG